MKISSFKLKILVLTFVSKYLGKKSEIKEELIKEIHKILIKNVRGGTLNPGNYRKIQNYVVNSLTGDIIYTPPPPLEVPGLMMDFIQWLNIKSVVSSVLVAGIDQYQLVYIHPFHDGNGRTARVLCTLILYQYGYDFKRLFSLSEYYDKDRSSYYSAIQSVRDSNMDMTDWLEYFVDGLKAQLIEMRIKGEITIKNDIVIVKSKKLNLNERQQKILIYLLENKKSTVKEICQHFNLIRRTIQRDLSKLTILGVIKEVAKSETDPTKYYELL